MPAKPQSPVNATVASINSLSAQFENAYQQLSDKYNSLADTSGAASAGVQTNSIQTEAAISKAEQVTESANRTKQIAIAAVAVVALIALIFFWKH